MRSSLIARTAALTLLSSGVFALTALAPANAAYDPDASCGSPAPGVQTHKDNVAPTADDVTVDDVVVGQGRTIDLSHSVHDEDGDVVSVVGIDNPKNGYVCQQGNEVYYKAYKPGTETLRYGVTDGATYRTANLTITTRALVVKAPQVLTKAKLVKGKVTKPAKVRFFNADPQAPVAVEVIKIYKDSGSITDYGLAAGHQRDLTTNYRTLLVDLYPTSPDDDDDYYAFSDDEPAASWRVDTVTGKVSPIRDDDFRRAAARLHH